MKRRSPRACRCDTSTQSGTMTFTASLTENVLPCARRRSISERSDWADWVGPFGVGSSRCACCIAEGTILRVERRINPPATSNFRLLELKLKHGGGALDPWRKVTATAQNDSLRATSPAGGAAIEPAVSPFAGPLRHSSV